MASHVSRSLRVDLGNLETLSGSHYSPRIALHYNLGLTDRHSLQRQKSCHPGWLQIKFNRSTEAEPSTILLHSRITACFSCVFVLITLIISQFGANIAKSELPFLALIHLQLGGGLLLPRPLHWHSSVKDRSLSRSLTLASLIIKVLTPT